MNELFFETFQQMSTQNGITRSDILTMISHIAKLLDLPDGSQKNVYLV